MKVKFFQEGGTATPQSNQQPTQDPIADIINRAKQAISANDGNMALEVLKALITLVEQAAPQAAQPASPTYQRKGGKLVRKQCKV